MTSRAYTAGELARLLPELGKKAAVARRALAHEWPYREEQGRGGVRRVYPLDTLPADIQARLVNAPPTGPDLDAPEAHLELARERMELVRQLLERVDAGLSVRDAADVIAGESGTPPRTLRRWLNTVRELDRVEWLGALLPRWQGGGRAAQCNERVWEYFRDDYLRASKPAFRAVYRRTRDVAKEQGWSPVPSLKSLRARLEREVPYEVRVLRREGRDALQRLYPAQQRTRAHLRAMQALNADGHRFDVMVRWPDGETSRPALLAFQDLYSGKIVGWRLDRTENADLVRLAFADAVETYGVPEDLYLDNGRAFASKWITGGARYRFRFKVREEEPVGVVRALGVEVHWTTPYHGQSKPIERAFLDLCESIAKHPLCDGAYTGRSTETKPHNYGRRTVELTDFLALVTREIDAHNAREGRTSEVCAGRSFDEVFLESYAAGPVRRASESQRRMLLLAAEKVRVRQGTACVHLLGNRYWAPALAPLQGQDVVIRFDPQRLKNPAHIYRIDGAYLCAADCQSAVGFDDAAAARAHARSRSAFLKATRAASKAQEQFSSAELAEMHLGLRAKKAKPASNVVAPIFGSATRPPPAEPADAAPDRDDGDDLVAELGRAAQSSGRLRSRRASNE